MTKKIKIGSKFIGENQPVFIIAEAGVNHNGDFNMALKMVDVALEAGVDAVKFQTFIPELVVTEQGEQAHYQAKNTGKKESMMDMIKPLALTRENFLALKKYCAKKNIMFLSTPFSEPDADFLETLNVPVYKVSSGDITNTPLLERIAKKAKPIILSTGMSSLAEVRTAVKAIFKTGNHDLILLHCTSNYPANPVSLNLRAITTLAEEFGLVVGYSDHSAGNLASSLAVALGASVIEKHFTLDKNLPGPDHKASLDPKELKNFVKAIRQAEIMLGSPEKKCLAIEKDCQSCGRRSIVAATDIPAGKVITKKDLVMKRPGTGITPTQINKVIGQVTKNKIKNDTIITWDLLAS